MVVAAYNIHINPRNMEHIHTSNGLQRQRPETDHRDVYKPLPHIYYLYVRRVQTMVQTKALIILGDIMAWGFTALGIIQFIDNTRAVIAFIIGIIYLGFRAYFSILKMWRKNESEEIDLAQKRREWHRLTDSDKIKT